MATVTQLDTDMSSWAPETRHYETSDGDYLAVTMDPGVPSPEVVELLDAALLESGAPTIESGKNRIEIRPTIILSCNNEGIALNLTPLHIFDPSTTHEEALTAAGFEVVQ